MFTMTQPVDRPYRKVWAKEDTLALIKEESGSHFDPEVVEVFFNLVIEIPKNL